MLGRGNRASRWILVTGIFVSVEYGVIPQRNAGFRCNDHSLSYPYRGDTISGKVLLVVATLLPIIVMTLLEAVNLFNNSVKCLSRWVLVLRYCEEYSFGLLVNIVLVDTLKVLVGEPRPHFFDVCNPDAECKGEEFVASYRCTETIYSESGMADSARSFPSGHTSAAVHAAGFLVWYLHKRTEHIRGSAHYLIASAQVLLVLAAMFCGLSRITDHRHHWWDVLAGALFGAGTLVYTIPYRCDNFTCLELLRTSPRISNVKKMKM